jgi:uncharacterized membrane protein YdjX (TVP38/TMEM64 family)
MESGKPAPSTSAREPDLAELWAQGKQVFSRLGPVGPMALVAASLPAVGTLVLLYLLKQTEFGPWLRAQGGTGMALYVIGYVVLAGLAVCNTYAPSLVGGFAFGAWMGGAAAMTGVCAAAITAFFAVRWMSGDRVTSIIAEQPKWRAVRDALIGGGFWRTLGIVALIRVSSSPFAVTNLVLGSTRVNTAAYILGTITGFAPRTLATVIIGAHLSHWDPNAKSKWLVIGGIVVTLVVLGIIGTIANHAVQKVTGQLEPGSGKEQP